MNILIIEPYYTGSHKQWAEGYKKFSRHNIKILSMEGRFWKWRMHGGAITMAKAFNNLNWKPNCILATDMIDLSTFISLTKDKCSKIPIYIYFHENQLSYPWSPNDRDLKNNRNEHYGFINYTSALAADKIFFNSKFHMEIFTKSLKKFLKQFPDNHELDSIQLISQKSQPIYLGLDYSKFNNIKVKKFKVPLILWNHRWEYDKNPEDFFLALEKIKNEGLVFKLAILGENFSSSPDIFNKAKNTFENEIAHWGYIGNKQKYAKWLHKADILPVTSNQDFFGISVMEAIYCNTWPILPNRLAYPELIPKHLHKNYFYEDNASLYTKLKWSINNLDKIRKINLKTIATKYDWARVSTTYDKIFSEEI